VLVRTLTVGDLDAVLRLEAATPEAPHWSRSAYEAFLPENCLRKQIFIVADSNQLLGFVAAQLVADICQLQSIVVDPAARRTGVATALLASLNEWARCSGAVRVELEVRNQNRSAIAFYERAGFLRNSVRRSYYRNPEDDAILMSLPLTMAPKP
jgi:[ribosomal protein S18]-alanine N-acetyltransferase